MKPEEHPRYRVVGKKDCPWCLKAVELLAANDLPYVYRDITESETTKDFLRFLGHQTVPLIWYDGELIGGYEELREWIGDDTH